MQTHVPLSEGSCNDYRTALRAELSDPARISFAGRYPASCGEKVWPVAYAEPASFAVRAVEGMWREMGGQLQGKVREGQVPAGMVPTFAFASPPLAEVLRTINKYSNNVMAQQLFLTLSLQQKGVGTLAGSRELLQDWWRERFGADDAPQVDNGSGLSRTDRVSAQALAHLLQYAWISPLMPELMASLPITGQDGTLKPERWRAKGNAHLKTGSLRDVAAVAGYVHAASGKRYVLVAIVNHPNANAVRPAIEALVEWAAKDL
jgi:D-alanyl-D-alanine carboxypeptidase/D-alanyl-D-alanine-endopeptidase (penicillin-binding protein 4)